MEALVDRLVGQGYDAERISSIGSMVDGLAKLAGADVVVLDVVMQRPPDMPEGPARGGHRTGFVLAQRLRQANKSLPIIAFSASMDPEVQEWFNGDPNLAFISKLNLRGIDDVVRRVERSLSPSREGIL